jgi:phosphatidylglycerol:prolipoprotein diacylglycerol transferase
MRRVLFIWRGIEVHSYPAFLYAGLLCGFYVIYLVAPSEGLPRDRAATAALVLMVPGLVGARIWFVAKHWSVYRRELRRVWRRSEGGMALYGGLVLSLTVSPGLLAALGVGFARFWDAATFTMLVGMIFTRIGCLLNGCCSGRPASGRFALRLRDHTGRSEPRYPVQLLEFTCAMLLLAAAFGMLSARLPPGTIFVFAFLGYSSFRVAFDGLRERPSPGFAGFRPLLAAFLACSMVAWLIGWLATA